MGLMPVFTDFQKAVLAQRARKILVRASLYFFLFLWLAICLTPVLWMVLGSLKSMDEVIAPRLKWLPEELKWENYEYVIRGIDFWRYTYNSVVVAVVTTLLNVLLSSMAGYGFSKFRFRGRRLFFLFILSSIMIPFQVIMIPLFIMAKNLHLLNSLRGLILPASVTAFGVFLMRQTIVQLPNEFCDAARLDGAGEFYIFAHVVLPLAAVGVATLSVLHFLANWNSFVWPFLIIHKDALNTLPLALSRLKGEPMFGGFRYERLMSVSVLMSVPVIVLYIVFNRFMTRGLTLGGLKG